MNDTALKIDPFKIEDLPLKAQAALYLMEPSSGIDWLDAMISKANKRNAIVSAALANEKKFAQSAGMQFRMDKTFRELGYS